MRCPLIIALLVFSVSGLFSQSFIEDAPPKLGVEYSFTITPPPGLASTFNLVCYRIGGTTNYTIVPLVENGGNFRGSIPGDLMTERGVEFYISFSDLQTTVTVPPGSNDDNPATIRIEVNNYISPRINLPVNRYRMISVPMELRDPQPQAVLEDDLGSYNPEAWRLFRLENGELQQVYQEYPNILSRFLPGSAFWIIINEPGSFDVDSALTLDASGAQSVFLQRDWNQIGNPFAFPIAWSDVTKDVLTQGPYFYDGFEFTIVDTLFPWEGYFVFNGQAASSTLVFNNTGGGGEKISAKASAGGFQVQLAATLEDTDWRDTQNFAGWCAPGVSPSAFQLPEPPAITRDLQLSIVAADQRYMRYLGEAPEDGASWQIEVYSEAGGRVNIELQQQEQLPPEFELYLLDQHYRNRIVPDSRNRYALDLNAGERRMLSLLAGKKEWADSQSDGIPLLPQDYQLEQNFPNPFNPETHIRYTLNRREPVRLEIYNLLGQNIRTLVNEIQDTGSHVSIWNGNDAFGNPVASGVYLYRLSAGSFNATRKMMLIR